MESLKDELPINAFEIKKAPLGLRAIDHPLQQRIFFLLHKRKKITVTDLCTELRLEQAVASQHLAILRKLRKGQFVLTAKEGRFVYYSVNYKYLAQVQTLVATIV